MKAVLKFHEKYRFDDRYIIEISFYEVNETKLYPHGVKYGLICYDSKSGDRVLIDNHHPKSHHIHLGSKELAYEFVSPEQLIKDFKKYVFEHIMGVKL